MKKIIDQTEANKVINENGRKVSLFSNRDLYIFN
jgi:hypothetical protein